MMRRAAMGLGLWLLLAAPALADCAPGLDFGRYPIDSVVDSRLAAARDCLGLGECAFTVGGVRYLAAAFESKAPPRIIRKTIDTDWSAAPFGLRAGDTVEVARAKLRRGGVVAATNRTRDGRSAVSTTCVVRGVALHVDALFTARGGLASLTTGVETPAD